MFKRLFVAPLAASLIAALIAACLFAGTAQAQKQLGGASVLRPIVCGSASSSCVLKNAPGVLYSAYAECSAACWLMVFNAAAAPANGATTAGTASGNMVECVPVAAGGSNGVSYLPGPAAAFTTGITAAISSTSCATLTASAVGFIHGMAQ